MFAVSTKRVLPGFTLSLGTSLLFVCLILLLPLSALVMQLAQMSWAQYWDVVTNPQGLVDVVLGRLLDPFGNPFLLQFAAAMTGGLGEDALETIGEAPWIGLPQFHRPEFHLAAVLVTLPVLVVLR